MSRRAASIYKRSSRAGQVAGALVLLWLVGQTWWSVRAGDNSFNATLQASAQKFREIKLEKDKNGLPKLTLFRFNQDPVIVEGHRYDGFRFTSGAFEKQYFLWAFVPTVNVKHWYILPVQGEMSGFTGFLSQPTSGIMLVDSFCNRHSSDKIIQQVLPEYSWTSKTTYIIWFEFTNDQPADIPLVYRFIEGKLPEHRSDEVLLKLGLVPVKAR